MSRVVIDRITDPFEGPRIYLAARYGRRDELREYRDALAELGCETTGRWLDTDSDAGDAGDEGDHRARQGIAIDCLEDIERSDLLIAFTEAPSSGASRGGRHVEFGLAVVTCQLGAAVIGPRESVFHCLPGVPAFDAWPDFLVWWAEHLFQSRAMKGNVSAERVRRVLLGDESDA